MFILDAILCYANPIKRVTRSPVIIFFLYDFSSTSDRGNNASAAYGRVGYTAESRGQVNKLSLKLYCL